MFYSRKERSHTSVLLSFYFGITALALSACGPTEKLTLKGVDVSTSETADHKTYVNLEAIIAMGNLKFPNMELPVYHPETKLPMGHMTLQGLNDGSNRVVISVDYEQATKLNADLGKTLPNGREIPGVLGAENAILVGIPAIEQSRIYIGGDLKKDLFIGVAVAIPAFDSVLADVPIPLNIFYNYPFSPEVTGVAGLFTGPIKGQNGVAVFAKRSVIEPTPTPAGLMNRMLASFTEKTATPTTPSAASTEQKSEAAAATAQTEINKMSRVTLFRLDRLLKKHAIVKVK